MTVTQVCLSIAAYLVAGVCVMALAFNGGYGKRVRDRGIDAVLLLLWPAIVVVFIVLIVRLLLFSLTDVAHHFGANHDDNV